MINELENNTEIPTNPTLKSNRVKSVFQPNTIYKMNPQLPRTPAFNHSTTSRPTLILNEETLDLDLGDRIVNLNDEKNLTEDERKEAIKQLEDYQKRVTLVLEKLKR